MVVLKEFPLPYRRQLACFTSAGYARIPSMPMTRLNIAYNNFEHYLTTALSKNTRKNLRRKFRDAEAGGPIELTILDDISPMVDELLPLYMQVYDRSPLHFEKLTREFLCRLGREMPDKAKFFVWRKEGRAIAFSICCCTMATFTMNTSGWITPSPSICISISHVSRHRELGHRQRL